MAYASYATGRARAKLKLWYKLVKMAGSRYAKERFSQEWNVKPCRGDLGKCGVRCIIYKCEWSKPIGRKFLLLLLWLVQK